MLSAEFGNVAHPGNEADEFVRIICNNTEIFPLRVADFTAASILNHPYVAAYCCKRCPQFVREIHLLVRPHLEHRTQFVVFLSDGRSSVFRAFHAVCFGCKALVFALQFFDLIYIMTKGGPVKASETMATYMYDYGFKRFALGYGAAVSLVIFVICFGFALAYQRTIMNREVAGAMG